METTLVVTVTLKVNAKGDTPDELISDALNKTMDEADKHFGATWDDGVTGVSVEGANVLVERKALDRMFQTEPTTACQRYGHHFSPTWKHCNRCGLENPVA